MKIVDKATQMAQDGSGKQPRYLAPIAHDGAARRQFSFSRLTGALHARMPDVGLSPLDAEAPSAPPLDARGLGTLVHAVLAQIDFARPEDVLELVRRHADEHLSGGDFRHLRGHRPEIGREVVVGEIETVPLDGASSVNGQSDEPAALIRQFLASPRAAEIAAASRVYREVEFLLAWPPDAEKSNGLHLQGFIDCLYCDAAGKWKLLDYKTNRVTEDGLAAAAAQYELQMLVYALAAERILKSPPTELVLCFLRPGLEYHFTWDAAARQRAVQLVNIAMSQMGK